MKRTTIVIASILVYALGAHAQDFKKVVDIVAEMETSLKNMIAKEESQRRAEVSALKSQVDELRTTPAQTAITNAGRPNEEHHENVEILAQRIEALEKKAGAIHPSQEFIALQGQLSSLAPSIETSGFIDFYYSKNFAQPANRTNKMRNFDIQDNQSTLSLAELVFQKKASPVGFRIDADFGTTNDLVQTGSGSATLPFVQQAYLTAVLPIGDGLTVDAGKFVTHMGNEVIESKDNWNYSRSLLFAWAIPYYHTGIRLAYPVASNLTAAIHICNGWNSIIDNNDFKSLGLTLNYALTSSTGLIFNAMNGVEQADSNIAGKRTVFDVIVSHQLTEALSLAANADYGQERTFAGLAIWKGAAVYGKYTIDPKSTVVLRGEVYYDPVGYTTGAAFPKATFKEVTLTYEYRPFDPLLVRCELRDDFSNSPYFDKKTSAGTENSQLTLLVGVVAIF